MKTPPDVLLIGGYPTEEYLAWIDTFRPENVNTDFDALEFIEVIREGWYFADWGFHLRRPYKKVWKLRMSTGGWSGNEEIMEHIKGTWFYLLCWREHRAGGHYTFEIPVRE